MPTHSEKLDGRSFGLSFETDASVWDDLSAGEYFSNLTRYLQNITIFTSRPRASDLIHADTGGGLAWLIAIPVAYFFVVALVLGVLLLCFWYVDKTGGVSQSHSEASISAAPVFNEKHGSTKHDSVIIKETHNSLHQPVFRSYLLNTECQDILRMSDSSKGSTRSLGVLTEKDLQVPPKISALVKSPDFTPVGRRQSVCVQEYSIHDICASDRQFDSRTFTRVKSNFKTALETEIALKIADESISSRNVSSFSTDSLEEKAYADSIRANMQSHKKSWLGSGQTAPGDSYGCYKVVPGSNERRFVEDADKNRHTEEKMDRKLIFLNHMFTGKRMYDADAHLKETYEIALNADKLNSCYRISENQFSSSRLPTMHFPGHEYSDVHRHEITPFRNAYILNNEHSGFLSATKQKNPSKNTGTNCQKMQLGVCTTRHNNTEANNDNHIKTRLFISDDSINESQLSSAFFTEEDTHSSDDHTRGHYHNDTSLVSVVLSDGSGPGPFQDHHKGNIPAPENDLPEFDISSVSQIAMSSQEEFDDSQGSLGSGGMRLEGSFCSANNSLPSSIARFHASNVGQWPSPCAGYPLPSDSDLESSRRECLCQSCRGSNMSRSSLSVNFGSCSESTNAGSRGTSSQNNSPHLHQNGAENDHRSNKLEQGLVKLSKRPSPLSSFVNNIRQKYSLDDNCLKSKRAASDEEEALLLSPVVQKDFGSMFNKQRSLESKRRKVSAEERLQEYGFLKCKGDKYVINPSPGKYETGAGYYNLVFVNNEDICETPRHREDQDNKQSFTSRVNSVTNDRMDNSRLAEFSESSSISQPSFCQYSGRSVSACQYSPFMEDTFCHFSQSRFNQRENNGGATTVFGIGTEGTDVFEAHCGNDSRFSDIDLQLTESRTRQIAREKCHDLSSLSDRGFTNAFGERHVDLAASEKSVHKTLFVRGYDSPRSGKRVCSGLPNEKTQASVCEQTEAGAYDNTHKSAPGRSQYEANGKCHNSTYEKCQNDTYRKGRNDMHEKTQLYENNHNGVYEHAFSGGCTQVQNSKCQNNQQHVVTTMELEQGGKSTFPGISNLGSSSNKTAAKADNRLTPDALFGKAAGVADVKLRRQHTSRSLLSLGPEVSGLCEIRQDLGTL
ncbi:hypothetical protein BsWGS_19445 [Bradybaena similaris]